MTAPDPPSEPPSGPGDILRVLDVQERAKREAETLAHQADWETAFNHATVQLTELVNPIPSNIAAYYIVDFRIGARQTGRLMMDARTGNVRAIAGIDKTHATMPQFLSRQEVLSRLVDHIIMLPTDLENPFVASHATVDDHMVWQPCDQSRSPFQAFYVAREGFHELFVRADGVAFSSLTQLGAG